VYVCVCVCVLHRPVVSSPNRSGRQVCLPKLSLTATYLSAIKTGIYAMLVIVFYWTLANNDFGRGGAKLKVTATDL
jgi:hypothetical protein